MKLCTIFIFLTIYGHSQINYTFNRKPFDGWHLYETKAFQSGQLNNGHFYFEDEIPPFLLDDPKAWHFVQLDDDQEDELIYNQYIGYESIVFVIFDKRHGQYHLNNQLFGTISNITRMGSKWTFELYDYGCCASYIDHFTLVELQNGSDLKKLIITESLAFVNYSKVPEFIPAPWNFEVTLEKYNMRIEPKIEEIIGVDDYQWEPIEGQNISAQFSKGDKGIAYASNIDLDGKDWWLVAMEKPATLPYLHYEGNNDFANFKLLGWMSAKYLKKLE